MDVHVRVSACVFACGYERVCVRAFKWMGICVWIWACVFAYACVCTRFCERKKLLYISSNIRDCLTWEHTLVVLSATLVSHVLKRSLERQLSWKHQQNKHKTFFIAKYSLFFTYICTIQYKYSEVMLYDFV